MGLSNDQVAFFKREGYLVAKNVIPRTVIENLQREISAVVDESARKLFAEGKITDLCENLDFLRRLDAIQKQCPEIMGPVSGGTHAGPALFAMMTNPQFLDAVESLVGPEIIASAVYRIRPKLPFDPAHEVPWHQDSGYFRTSGDKHLILTTWIPLMNATVEAGCMEVIPRSHTRGVVRHFWANIKAPSLSVHPDHLPEVPPVPVPADIGDVVFLTNLTMHRSTPNTSGLIRWAVDLRYNSDQVGDIYPYEAEFVARSQAHPEKVCTSAERFRKIRSEHKPVGTVDRSWLKEAAETFIKPPR